KILRKAVLRQYPMQHGEVIANVEDISTWTEWLRAVGSMTKCISHLLCQPKTVPQHIDRVLERAEQPRCGLQKPGSAPDGAYFCDPRLLRSGALFGLGQMRADHSGSGRVHREFRRVKGESIAASWQRLSARLRC